MPKIKTSKKVKPEPVVEEVVLDDEKETRRKFLLGLQDIFEKEHITRASDIELKLKALDRE